MYPPPLCYLVCWLLGLHSPIAAIAELPMCNICLPLFPSNPIKSIGDVDIKDIGGHGLGAEIQSVCKEAFVNLSYYDNFADCRLLHR